MKTFNKIELEILCEELSDEFTSHDETNDSEYGDRQQIREDLYNQFKKELERKG